MKTLKAFKTLSVKHWSILGLVLLAAGWWLFKSDVAMDQIKYHTQPLSVGQVESLVNSSGAISPVVTVEVGSEMSGLITQLNVDFNDMVTSGQVIARIDDRIVLTRLRQSEADLAVAQATLVQLKAALSKAQTELALAKREYQRKKKLHEKKQISISELDISETAFKLAKVAIKTANAAILAGEARVMQTQASLEQVQLDLERTYIRSPVDGVVIDRQVDKGQAVSASLSAPTLFFIAQDLVKMQIEAAVDEADIGRIKQSQQVRFTVDAFPQRKFNGIVSQVRKAATVTNNVVTYKVIISLDNKDLLLLPGMTANVDIILGQRSEVLRVPNSALRFSPETGAGGSENESKSKGSDISKRNPNMQQQLNLSAGQQQQFLEVMKSMQNSMQELRKASQSAGGPPPDMRELMVKLRTNTLRELQTFLTPQQIKLYQEISDQRSKAFASGGQNSLYQRGTVWILRDGKPHKVNVGVGIADQEFSEIVSDELHEGETVIVRAQRIRG